MNTPDDDYRRTVALFRYGVITEALHLSRGELAAFLRAQAARQWTIPHTRRTRISEQTMRDWMRAYRRNGLDGLMPKKRGDRGQQRRMSPRVIEVLLAIKSEQPDLSIKQVIARARASGEIDPEQPLPPSTLHRLFAREGLMVRTTPSASGDLRRFAWPHAGDLWQSDVMHGPLIADSNGRMRKTYLLAFIDDATRVVPYAVFTRAENAATFMPVLREAIKRRGMPRRLFVDNGANYRSRQLALICARLGISLIHGRARHPAGKGKIERWFRTVRGWLATIDKPGSLEELNHLFRTWVESTYHESPHRGLDNLTPFEKWAECCTTMAWVGPETDLDDLFLFETKRKVSRSRTVSLKNRLYEVDAALSGETVVLRYDPMAPPQRPIKVVHDGKPAGEAVRVELHANARIRRNATLTFRTDETE